MIAFREEIGGGAQGIVEAVAKFGNILIQAAAMMLLTNVGDKICDFVSNIPKLSFVINIMLSPKSLQAYLYVKQRGLHLLMCPMTSKSVEQNYSSL